MRVLEAPPLGPPHNADSVEPSARADLSALAGASSEPRLAPLITGLTALSGRMFTMCSVGGVAATDVDRNVLGALGRTSLVGAGRPPHVDGMDQPAFTSAYEAGTLMRPGPSRVVEATFRAPTQPRTTHAFATRSTATRYAARRV